MVTTEAIYTLIADLSGDQVYNDLQWLLSLGCARCTTTASFTLPGELER